MDEQNKPSAALEPCPELRPTQFERYFADVNGDIWSTKRGAPYKLAKGKNPRGYFTIGVSIPGIAKTKSKGVHVLVCYAFHGPKPTAEHEVRHLNGIKTDNSPSNLKWGTEAENVLDRQIHMKSMGRQFNMHNRISDNNTSGARGVTVRNGRFIAQIKIDRRMIYIGRFGSLDEAAHAYNKRAMQAFGEYACLNPIGEDKSLLQPQQKSDTPR